MESIDVVLNTQIVDALVTLDELANDMRRTAMAGHDLASSLAYNQFLDHLEVVTEFTGVDWLDVITAIQANHER